MVDSFVGENPTDDDWAHDSGKTSMKPFPNLTNLMKKIIGLWLDKSQGLGLMSRYVSHHPAIGDINPNKYICCGDVKPIPNSWDINPNPCLMRIDLLRQELGT